jgi:antitoxin component of MazEF toxin-antitoxin module
MQENVRPVMAPRSRPSLQHVFIPPKIRDYFDLKVGDLLKFDVVEKRIVIRVVRKKQ